ncbi:MAG: hypothetical protein R3F34_08730 [Planctomycetota bacterium]
MRMLALVGALVALSFGLALGAEVAERAVTAPSDDRLVLTGRAVRPDGAPLAGRVSIWISSANGHSASGSGRAARLDGRGRFRVEFAEQDDARYAIVTVTGEDPVAQGLAPDARARHDLTDGPRHGAVDLGDLVIAPWSVAGLRELDDDALIEAYEHDRRLVSLGADFGIEVEGALSEMARRGGLRFETYLRTEFERANTDGPTGAAWFCREDRTILLTALRRAERRADPLTLELATTEPLVVTFPGRTQLHGVLRNTDPDGLVIEMVEGGDQRSGRAEKLRVEAFLEDGTKVPAREWQADLGGGLAVYRAVAPGDAVDVSCVVEDYVVFPGPGVYEVRVAAHVRDPIAHVSSLEGRVVLEAEPVVVVLRALELRVARTRLDELRRAIDELPFDAPVPLLRNPWVPGLEFAREPEGPMEVLLCAGYEAVPALLEALDALDPRADLDRARWILGLLHDVTGLADPTLTGAVPSQRWLDDVPCVAVPRRASPFPFRHERDRRLREDGIARSIEAWRTARLWFDVTTTDR